MPRACSKTVRPSRTEVWCDASRRAVVRVRAEDSESPAPGGAGTADASSGEGRDGLAQRATVEGVTPRQSICERPKWVIARSKIANMNTLNVRSATGTSSQNAFPITRIIRNALCYFGASMVPRSSKGQGAYLLAAATEVTPAKREET